MNHRDKNKPYGGIPYTGDTASFILYNTSFLHIHLNPIHLKYTHIAKLLDSIRVKQLCLH